jgi:hypothetical protein
VPKFVSVETILVGESVNKKVLFRDEEGVCPKFQQGCKTQAEGQSYSTVQMSKSLYAAREDLLSS